MMGVCPGIHQSTLGTTAATRRQAGTRAVRLPRQLTPAQPTFPFLLTATAVTVFCQPAPSGLGSRLQASVWVSWQPARLKPSSRPVANTTSWRSPVPEASGAALPREVWPWPPTPSPRPTPLDVHESSPSPRPPAPLLSTARGQPGHMGWKISFVILAGGREGLAQSYREGHHRLHAWSHSKTDLKWSLWERESRVPVGTRLASCHPSTSSLRMASDHKPPLEV